MGPALLLSLSAALAQLPTQPRGPDGHDLRREPGDVMMVDGRPQAAPSHVRHGQYVGPYPGWTYRKLRVGQRLGPAFLDQRYSIANPAEFGLPAAGGGRRWIRYGDDAVLVAERSRRTVRVVFDRYL